MRRFPATVAAIGVMFAACETVPPEPVIVMMSDAEFDSALKAAKSDVAPFSSERKLTALIDSERATPEQRSCALYARAGVRWKKTQNKIAAKSDFDEYIRLYPDGVFTNNARIESGYVQNEITAVRSRLQTIQTLRDWFDDTWALGNWDEAAFRYRRSRLTPEPHQIYQLRATGFLCENTGNLKLHTYGPLTPEIQNLYWCK